MEPVQNPQKTRRRRWLIVALLFVLPGVAWLNWQRGDARFVGRWAWGEDGVARGEVRFRSSGVADFYGRKTSWVAWTVTGDSLVVGSVPETRLGRFGFQLPQWLFDHTGRMPAKKIYRIRKVDSDSIELSD